MKQITGVDLRLVKRDFYDWDPELPEDTFLVVGEPRGINERNLEEDVVRFAIERGVNIVLIPVGTNGEDYDRRFEEHRETLASEGYNVEARILSDLKELQYLNVLIATK